ncbi:MAG: tetratricopeptide repeat protein [Hyphomicrobium sp.]|uniref:tetratricopeptide repeat protein n=1 Tax=Hyphomicrobium sp. TaxID=82 RepID=UPI003D0BE327
MTGSATPSPPHLDYFISRSTRDIAIAQWIGQLISAQGRSYVEQTEHFGSEDFMVAMHKAMLSGAKTVALYSQSYLDSPWCVREATETLKSDPGNEKKQLIPLRIESCAPAGLLNVTYTDLLAERRQADASALARKICRALGLEPPDPDRLPPLQDGLLTTPPRIIHDLIRPTRSNLAPRPELMHGIAGAMSRAGVNSRHMVAAVAGMGGAGKSVLARNFANEHQDAYHAVWWIDAERRGATLTNMLSDIAALGAELSADIKSEALSNVEQAARKTLRLIEGAGYARPFLLIYDNVDRPQDIELWTPRSGAHILVTTRYGDWDDMVAKVDVGVLPPDIAIDFLLSRGKKKHDDIHERQAAEQLAEALGYLPLALDHAASYCAGGRGVSFAEYLGLYEEKLRHEPEGASGAYGKSVRTTFELALDRAIAGDATLGIKGCPEASIVMGVAALLAPVPLPFSLFSHHLLRSANLDAAFRSLGDVSLIQIAHDTGSFSVHRVVQAIMRDRLAEAGETEHAVRLANELLTTAMPHQSEDFAHWDTCKALAPHALAVLAQSLDLDVAASRAGVLAYNLAKYLNQVARYSEAEPLLKRSLELDEKALGAEHPDTSATLHVLAGLYETQGRYEEAEPLLNRSLAIYEKAHGVNHSSTATTLYDLGHLYHARGRYAKAEPLLKRALAIYEATLGTEHPYTSTTLHALGRLCQTQGRYSEADSLLKMSLAIYEKGVGAEHPFTAATLQEVAALYQAQGLYAEAEPLLDRALAIKEKKVGAEHPSTAVTLCEQGRLYQAQGRHAEAEPLLKRALAIYEKAFGENHLYAGSPLRSLAETAHGMAKPTEARAQLDRAWSILAPHWAAEHVRWAQVLNTAALIEITEGKAAEAEATARAALQRRLAVFSCDHPEIAQSKWTLARALLALGRPTEALPLLHDSIAMLEAKVTAEQVWLKGARATLTEAERQVAALQPPPGERDKPRAQSSSWWRRFVAKDRTT